MRAEEEEDAKELRREVLWPLRCGRGERRRWESISSAATCARTLFWQHIKRSLSEPQQRAAKGEDIALAEAARWLQRRTGGQDDEQDERAVCRTYHQTRRPPRNHYGRPHEPNDATKDEGADQKAGHSAAGLTRKERCDVKRTQVQARAAEAEQEAGDVQHIEEARIGKRKEEQPGTLQAQAAHSDLSRSKSVEQPTVAKHSSSQSSLTYDEHTHNSLLLRLTWWWVLGGAQIGVLPFRQEHHRERRKAKDNAGARDNVLHHEKGQHPPTTGYLRCGCRHRHQQLAAMAGALVESPATSTSVSVTESGASDRNFLLFS